jgi:hypothetical protein
MVAWNAGREATRAIKDALPESSVANHPRPAGVMMMLVVTSTVPVNRGTRTDGSLGSQALRFVPGHNFGFIGAFFVALMGDPGMGVHSGEKRRRDHTPSCIATSRASRCGRCFTHSPPGAERAAAITMIVV